MLNVQLVTDWNLASSMRRHYRGTRSTQISTWGIYLVSSPTGRSTTSTSGEPSISVTYYVSSWIAWTIANSDYQDFLKGVALSHLRQGNVRNWDWLAVYATGMGCTFTSLMRMPQLEVTGLLKSCPYPSTRFSHRPKGTTSHGLLIFDFGQTIPPRIVTVSISHCFQIFFQVLVITQSNKVNPLPCKAPDHHHGADCPAGVPQLHPRPLLLPFDNHPGICKCGPRPYGRGPHTWRHRHLDP